MSILYGVLPYTIYLLPSLPVKRLELCGSHASCGGILFHGKVEPPPQTAQPHDVTIATNPGQQAPSADPGPGCLDHHCNPMYSQPVNANSVSSITGQLNWVACVRHSAVYLYRFAICICTRE